jgi:hypothetical protein
MAGAVEGAAAAGTEQARTVARQSVASCCRRATRRRWRPQAGRDCASRGIRLHLSRQAPVAARMDRHRDGGRRRGAACAQALVAGRHGAPGLSGNAVHHPPQQPRLARQHRRHPAGRTVAGAKTGLHPCIQTIHAARRAGPSMRPRRAPWARRTKSARRDTARRRNGGTALRHCPGRPCSRAGPDTCVPGRHLSRHPPAAARCFHVRLMVRMPAPPLRPPGLPKA